MRIVDLSIPIDDSTPFCPGDRERRVRVASTIAHDGFAAARPELGSHSGTHCDAPSHGVRTIRIDTIDIDRTPRGQLDPGTFRRHRAISRAAGVIDEDLAGVGAIAGLEARVSARPLHTPDCDGAPTRAVAFVED